MKSNIGVRNNAWFAAIDDQNRCNFHRADADATLAAQIAFASLVASLIVILISQFAWTSES